MSRERKRTAWWLGLALCVAANPAAADHDAAVPRSNDPLDARDLDGLEDAALAMRAAALEASRRPPEPIEGAVLGARPGTRELSHEVSITFEGAIATIAFVSTIGNRGEHATPVRVSWPLRAPFAVEEAQACLVDGDRCVPREARTTQDPDSTSLAIDSLAPSRDARFTVRVAVPLDVRGGVARVLLPPRRGDARVGPSSVRTLADAPSSIDGTAFDGVPIEVDASRAIDARAVLRRDGAIHATLAQGRCGERPCSVFHLVADPDATTERVRGLLLLVDASRSTEGDARNRIRAALDALRAMTPGVPARLVAFGEEALAIVEDPRPLGTLTDAELVAACSTPLGATTRPDRALARFHATAGELVLVLGDGGFTPSPQADDVARRLSRAHGDVRYLDVATVSPRSELVRFLELARARSVPLGIEADEAVSTGRASRLREALSEALDTTPEVEVRVRGADSAATILRLSRGRSLWRVEPGRLRATVASHRLASKRATDTELALAGSTLAVRSVEPPARTPESVPPEIVQAMVRSQVIPKARGCLRDDRHGRARYSVRAELRFRFAEREVTDADVVGAIDEPLRACLLEALSRLEVPRFEGAIRVRYPLRTLEAEAPVVYELDPDVRARVDAIGRSPSSAHERELERDASH